MIVADGNKYFDAPGASSLLATIGHFAHIDIVQDVDDALDIAFFRQKGRSDGKYYEVTPEIKHLVRSGFAQKCAPLHGIVQNLVGRVGLTCYVCYGVFGHHFAHYAGPRRAGQYLSRIIFANSLYLEKSHAEYGAPDDPNEFRFYSPYRGLDEFCSPYLCCVCDECGAFIFKNGHKFSPDEGDESVLPTPLDWALCLATGIASRKFRERLLDSSTRVKNLRFKPDVYANEGQRWERAP